MVEVDELPVGKAPPLYLPSDIIVGITYMVLPSLILPIYIIIIYLFFTDDKLSRLQSYRVMIHLGISDCIQLCMHFGGGILTLLKFVNYDYPLVGTLIGSILNGAWVGLFPISLIISITRLLILQKFSGPSCELSTIIRVAVYLSWIYSIMFGTCCFTLGKIAYSPERWAWVYGPDDWSKFLSSLEFKTCMPMIVLMFIIYLIAVYSLTTILLQALILFVNLSLLLISWHYHHIFINESKWTHFVINSYWILYCGLNPLLYLTMAGAVRRRFFGFLRMKIQLERTISIF